jgi:hypothetical protein
MWQMTGVIKREALQSSRGYSLHFAQAALKTVSQGNWDIISEDYLPSNE